MHGLLRQLRTAARSLARQPGATLSIVATLALGIGAATALSTYLATLLWPRLDAPRPERIVSVYAGSREDPRALLSLADFQDLQSGQRALTDLIGYSPFGGSVASGGSATFAWGQTVSGGYFDFFAVHPALGRLLSPADDRPGAERAVVLGYSFWKRLFGGDPGVPGRTVRLNGRSFTIVGVAPKGFQGHGQAVALYVTVAASDVATGLHRLASRDMSFLWTLGRIAPGIRLGAGQSALDLWAQGLDAAAPLAAGPRRMALIPASRYDPENGDPFFLEETKILAAAAALFLLLACASVANLLLARSTARRHDASLRAALGASRWQIALGFLLESLLLAVAGGTLGVPLALALARRLEGYATTHPVGIGLWSEGGELFHLDARLLGTASAAALLAGLLCSLGPGVAAFRRDLLSTLKSESGGSAGGATLAVRKLLVVLQVTLSVLLLLGAGLLTRSLGSFERLSPGFDLDRFALASVFTPRGSGPADDPSALLRPLLERVRALPGVEAVGAAFNPPLSGLVRETRAAAVEHRDRPETVRFNLVTDGFFAAVGLAILEGRPIDLGDRAGAPPVVVVDRTLARRLWGTEHVVGRTLSVPEPPRSSAAGTLFQVVGVAAAGRYSSLAEPVPPVVYFSTFQQSHPRTTLVIRSRAPLGELRRALASAVAATHPDLSIVEVASGRDALRAHASRYRMQAEVAGLLALLGLAVAALGLFGLLSYNVTLRARELSIRSALGSRPLDLQRLVVRQGMSLAALGLAAGSLAGLVLTRALRQLLFGVVADDPATYLAVILGLLAVAFLASYLPARRAARGNPLELLRER